MEKELQSILLIFIFMMFLAISSIRTCMQDGFEHKKSTTRIRKEKKELPAWRNLLCWYQPECTKVPWHMRLFRRLFIFYLVTFVCAIIIFAFSAHLPSVIAWLVMIPGFTVWVIVGVYCGFILSDGRTKRVCFEKAKRQ